MNRGARFGRNIILARLLAPEYFGLMALILVASRLFEAFTEVGVRQAVVQNKRGETREFLNVAWWFSATRGVGLAAFGLLLAPAISGFYEEPSLVAPLRVAFLSLVLSGMINPEMYVLEKRLQFGRYVWITQGAGLVATVVSLVAAIFIRNVWALVIGQVAEVAFQCAASFVFCPFRPTTGFDRASARELFSFARGMFGLPILTFLVLQSDVFVLGKVCTKEELGKYALARALANMPVLVYSSVIQPLMLPVLSGFQDDYGRLRDALLRMTQALALFGAPVAVILAVYGGPILSVAYGEEYAVMAPAFGILSVYFLLFVLGTGIASVYLAIGRPELHRRFTIVRAVLVAALMYPAARWYGPAGAAACLLLAVSTATMFQLPVLRKVIGLSARRYAAAGGRGLIVATGILGPAWIFREWLRDSSWFQLGAAGLVGGAAWLWSGLWLRRCGGAGTTGESAGDVFTGRQTGEPVR